VAHKVEPLPPAQHKPEPKSRARKDRPQQVAGAIGYLDWLRTQVDAQSGSVMLSQSQCAARLGCCVRTIKRYEKALDAQIERRVFARRQAGCLFILTPDVVTTSHADVVIADATIAQQSAENVQPTTMQEEHTAPLAPSPLVTLAEQVADAFDALAGHKRITWQKIGRYIAQLHGGDRPVADLKRAVDVAREEHKRQRMLDAITRLSIRGLKAELRLAEHMYDQAKAQRSGAARFWYVYGAKLRAEMSTRPAEPSKAKRRKIYEALPDPRAGVEQELRDLLEQERAQRKPARQQPASRGVGGACVLPKPRQLW
jgi:hypothetical protein